MQWYPRIHSIIIIILYALVFCNGSKAEPTPRWVKKGVKELNEKRGNSTYSFHLFHECDDNQNVFELDRFRPLLQYVDSVYGVSRAQLKVDSIPANGVLPTTYMIQFEKDGIEHTVSARLVDEYSKFSSEIGAYDEYNFYQLYAISEPGVTSPQWDDFTVTRNYGGMPAFYSLIPGLGQIYKGESAKGWSFMGIEAAMVASIIYASTRVHHFDKLADAHPNFYDNYQSKATSFRQWRAFCLIAGGALYVYNIFDAVFSKGARYVKILHPRRSDIELSFMPVISPTPVSFSYGVGINISF